MVAMQAWTPVFATAVVLLVMATGPAAQDRSVASQTQAASRNTESISFSDIGDVPADRTLLSDTPRETWYFIPSWSDTRSGLQVGSSVAASSRKYRDRSPFAVFDKTSKRWRTAAISRRAYEIYPVRSDPDDTSLIWFGVADARGSIIDWVGGFEPTGTVDDPLIFAGKPGGLGLIDTARQTVTYFGKYRDLVGGRLVDLHFEKDAVWIFARDYSTVEFNGLSRFDRRTRSIEPFPVKWHSYADAWAGVTFAASDTAVSLTVLENRGWFSRFEFDKVRREWRQPRFGWVSAADVPMFELPDNTSKRIDLLRPGMHFGQQGHGHFGHPIAILDERNGWQRVMTCQDTVGWTQSGLLVNTLEFFRLTLNSREVLQDSGNDGPRMFVWQARYYMTPDESQRQNQTLRNSELAAVVSRPILNVEEFRRAQHLLTMDNSSQLESGRYFWEDFAKRRQSLLRR